MSTTIEFKTAQPLYRALKNAHLFTDKESVNFVLECARITFDGHDLTFESTDRYRLFEQKVNEFVAQDGEEFIEGGGTPFELFIHHTELVELVKTLKPLTAAKYRSGLPVSLIVEDEGAKATLVTPGFSRTVEMAVVSEGWPERISKLWPRDADYAEISRIGFTPKYLVDLGKVELEARAAAVLTFPLVAEFIAPNRPAVFTFKDDSIRIMLMPVKLAG